VNPFAWTAIVVAAIFAAVALLVAAGWCWDRWERRTHKPTFQPESLQDTLGRLSHVTTALQAGLCAIIGLLAGLAYYLGWCADAPAWLR